MMAFLSKIRVPVDSPRRRHFEVALMALRASIDAVALMLAIGGVLLVAYGVRDLLGG